MPTPKTDVYNVEAPFPLDLRLVKTDVGARNNIPMVIRYGGLIVHTISDQGFWYWPASGTTNADWVQLNWIGGVSPRVWFSAVAPASGVGNDSDIYFHDTPAGVVIYQKIAGDWGSLLGTIKKGGATINNEAVAYGTTTSAWLDSNYPNSQPGDIVWSEVNRVSFTKLAANKWTVQIIEIA